MLFFRKKPAFFTKKLNIYVGGNIWNRLIPMTYLKSRYVMTTCLKRAAKIAPLALTRVCHWQTRKYISFSSQFWRIAHLCSFICRYRFLRADIITAEAWMTRKKICTSEARKPFCGAFQRIRHCCICLWCGQEICYWHRDSKPMERWVYTAYRLLLG